MRAFPPRWLSITSKTNNFYKEEGIETATARTHIHIRQSHHVSQLFSQILHESTKYLFVLLTAKIQSNVILDYMGNGISFIVESSWRAVVVVGGSGQALSLTSLNKFLWVENYLFIPDATIVALHSNGVQEGHRRWRQTYAATRAQAPETNSLNRIYCHGWGQNAITSKRDATRLGTDWGARATHVSPPASLPPPSPSTDQSKLDRLATRKCTDIHISTSTN